MLTFTLRRLGWAIPTLLVIALALFALIDLAPGDPLAQLPLGVSPEVDLLPIRREEATAGHR